MYKFISKSIISLLVFVSIACTMDRTVGVKHLVMFKFKEGTSQQQIDEFTKEFVSLKDRIPGIVAFDYGVNNSPEKLNNGFTHIYAISFSDNEARDTYLTHPEHEKFTEYAGGTGIIQEVFVLDYPPIEAK
ncbi:MAG: Dabb family protein [Cyclobacteriaceae bacterium]|nr:Dabb family protein [Cyclobacteriaceae bacterium]